MELHCHAWGRLEAHEGGPDHPTQLLFLHGLGGTGALWRPIVAQLEDRFAILAPDQRGHGRSRPVPESSPHYSPLDYGRDVIETVRARNFRPTWLIGHSMGVRTACAAAHLEPSLFRGLILVDLGLSGPAGGGMGDGLARLLRQMPMLYPDRQAMRQYLAEHCPDPSIAQYLMAVSVTTPAQATFPFDRDALVETVEASRRHPVGPWLRSLAEGGMPALVLRGEKSLVWSKTDYERERESFADLPAVVFEEMANAGHGLPFERRADFVERIVQFIESR